MVIHSQRGLAVETMDNSSNAKRQQAISATDMRQTPSPVVRLFFLLVIACVHLVTGHVVDGTCSRCQSGPQDHRLFGTKTKYTDALRQITSGPNVTMPDTCHPVMLYLFKRHAIRYPDGEDIPDMDAKLKAVRDKVLSSYSNGQSGLCEQAIDDLRNWKIGMKPEDDNLITESGFNETAEIARRLYERVPNLLNPDNEMDIAISNRIRTNQTARAFIQKLAAITDKSFDFNPSVNLELTDFHTRCEDYLQEQGVQLKKPPLYNLFQKSDAMSTLITALSKRLGLQKKLTAAEVKILFRGCAFGHAIHGDDAWCSVFTKQELRFIELMEDVDDYYGDAYGRDINQKAPCPVARDLMTHIDDVVLAETSGKPTGTTKRTFLRFSHAGAIKQLVSFFGLFDLLDTSLPALSDCDSEEWSSRSRDWRSSLIAPFSANFQFILYNCGAGSDFRLLTLLQEVPVTVRGCSSPLCPLQQFLTQYRPYLHCNLKQICHI